MSKTILIVDDHEDDRTLLEQLFTSQGYNILLASNGEVAQEILLSQTVDLVFSDVLMPIMDGLQLCKMIKTNDTLKKIPVILYTSIYSNEEDMMQATKVGADLYLIKPTRPESLILAVEQTINMTASKIENDDSAKEIHSPDSTEQYLRLYSTKLVQRLEEEVKKLGEEIIRRKKADEEQEGILNSMIDGVITINEIGEILSFNQSAESLFGYKKEDIIGKNVKILMPENVAKEHDKYLSQYKKTGEAHIIGIKSGREVIGKREDNDVFPMRLRIAKLPKDDDGKQRYIGTCQDLTYIKQQEEQLRRSQKMEALGKLTGGIAHDYNNMLGVVTGYAELLEMALKGQPKLAKYAHEIHHAGKRGAKLTTKLLGFSRLKSPNEQRLNINELLIDEQHMLEKTLTARIRMVFDLENNIWPIWVDIGDLEDAIINLCINAMHAIDGHGQLTLQTKNEHVSLFDAELLNIKMAGDYVVLRITDTGCGMDETTKEQIFDPFYSTKGDKGTGLGLSQVYGFIQRSHGVIKVQSELMHGTQISIYFPRYHSNNNNKVGKTKDDVANFTGEETILVVDDEPALLSLTREILNAQGYHVICANNAKEALDILENESIDLLLSDVIMPNMDGYELASIVQNKYPKIKIQMASGFSNKEYKDMEGNDLYEKSLSKPYSSQALLKKIRGLLDS